MSRYIDADLLYQKINGWRKQIKTTCGKHDDYVECLGEVLTFIGSEPNADVVEVVRCGQCCNADIRCEGLYCFCTLHEEYRTLDYFCASGGKKDMEDIEIANINL